MKLRGTELKRIRDAFLDAFNENELEQLVRIHLDVSLEDVAKGKTRRALVFDLIEWAERTDKVEQLLGGAIEERPTNTALSDLRDAIVTRERQEANAQKWFVEVFTGTKIEPSLGAEDRNELNFNYTQSAEKYRNRLIDLYSKQRMLGKPDEVSISDLFTDVYVLEKQTALRRFDIEQLMKHGESLRSGKPGERVRGFPLVAEGNNLYILGKPGAGKTTFMKYVTMQAAKGDLPKVPIFVSLNDWSNSPYGKEGQEALLPYIAEQFDLCRFPDAEPFIEKLLESGDALLLFDGLDEVRREGEQRRTLTRLLQDFSKKYNDCQCLITCRIAASDYLFEGFRDVEVADFTPEQVATYAEKWFAEFPHKLALFKTEIAKTENKGLAELCRSPLLLGMLCLYFDDAQEFPKRRAELYEEAIEALLKKWDSSRDIQRDYQALSARRKQQMFAWIAAQTFEENDYFVEQRRLVGLIEAYLPRLPDMPAEVDGFAVLKAIEAQHGIFVERAKGIYSFAHLTFQEYFVARYIIENEARGTTKSLAKKHLTDDRWREVFLLTASMLDDGDAFMAQIREQVDRSINDELALVDLLMWAEGKTQNAMRRDESKFASMRLAYISLDLILDLDFDRDFDFDRVLALERALIRDRVLILDRVLALEVAIVLSLDFDRILERALDFERSRDLDLILSLDFTRTRASAGYFARDHELVNNLSEDVGVDYGLLYTWQYASVFGAISVFFRDRYREKMDEFGSIFYPEMIAFVRKQLPVVTFAKKLESLPIPTSRDGQKKWQEFADALAEILTDERDFDFDRGFSYNQWRKMSIYFAANEFFLQCLDLATVSDRAGIKAGLLLPPKADGVTG